MTQEKSTPSPRYRNFATVVYPDSAPSDWLDRLSAFRVPAFVSPLHDRDINPTGEPKKPHFHVLLFFEGKKSCDQARAIFESFSGVGCEVVSSLRGYARYLCHLDNPEKAQYSPDDVRALCGADYSDVIGLPSDRYRALGEIVDFCDAEGIVSYAELVSYARVYRTDWFRVLADSGTYFVSEYLKSKAWTTNQASNCSPIEHVKDQEEDLRSKYAPLDVAE